ncbi:hypothetical protein CONPUDRAFT_84754 [Coniophora puteana RWD-64-598 SS2]|uniref:Uncharacterized protein n=1 Tax=Coniophora puteana (strain RWD-64-598) TaxID=741705 RepID=A0A5M3MCW9_CONPW|nr:uncharacterized protein CONPUDRAFT_84754 [Coniophora puteana RWD-64-598 SS2]EIW76923.1 hypothetical protein CONPUDRAFT_84754 [Coniophora puteana RWD-64-598 SS2]
MIVFGTAIASVMMLKRITALCASHRVVGYVMSSVLATWFGLAVWSVVQSASVPHSHVVHVCQGMIHPTNVKNGPLLRSSSFWMIIVYDTLVFILMLTRALPLGASGSRHSIARRLVTNGTLYYATICFSNNMEVITVLRADAGLKGLISEFIYLLQIIMMSRITLSLLKNHRKLKGRAAYRESRWEDAPTILTPIVMSAYPTELRRTQDDLERHPPRQHVRS